MYERAEDELSPPTRTLLFSPLGSTDMPSAVAHRLRAAIGLGLLPDGERLPKEADLAAQLGVTTFALREALAELRKQRLVVTRAGKYGGSFVTYPVASEQLEHNELLDLSTAELRDLGDWRTMLTAHAAGLAAGRASASNAAMLVTLAQRVGDAPDSVTARRAHGRFHLELAAAAQSMRMTRAEFAVHEQIDWLFGLTLRTGEERSVAALELRAIADAVREGDAPLARAAAEKHVARLMERLAHLRLEGFAARWRDVSDRGDSDITDAVRAVVDELSGQLQAFAEDVAPAMVAGGGYQQVRSRVSLAGLRHFEAFPAFVKGVGMLAEVGVLPDRPYWIEWWLRTDTGPVSNNHHVLDPFREDFYDYGSMEFMIRSRETRRTWAYGPYVDYGGIDDYIVTAAAPVVAAERFWGICCADVLVSDLESWLAPQLAESPEACLLNADGRVVVSNSIRYGVGDTMADRAGFEAVTFPDLGWELLVRS